MHVVDIFKHDVHLLLCMSLDSLTLSLVFFSGTATSANTTAGQPKLYELFYLLELFFF